jgi:signal peptide peptidase SppA
MPTIEDFLLSKVQAALPVGSLWPIEEAYAAILIKQLENIDLAAHVDAYNAAMAVAKSADSEEELPYQFSNGVAFIPVTGTITKRPVSLGNGTSTLQTRKAVRHASRNPDVNTQIYHIDSPGGSGDGLVELADDIYAARTKYGKRVVAYIEDMGCSAAYWIASQANEIYANEPAKSGNVGTFAVVTDYSGMAEKIGAKVHVLKSAKFKGIGVPGTKIEDEQLAYLQSKVEQFNEIFFNAVTRGRGLSSEHLVSLEAKWFIGQDAVDNNIVDGIRTLDEVIDAVYKADIMQADSLGLAAPKTSKVDRAANPPAVKIKPKTEQGKGGKRMDNESLAASFAAIGESALSTAVATAGDSADSVAKAIAKQRSAVDERVTKLDDAGIKTAVELEEVLSDAKYGMDQEEKLRGQVVLMAQRAFPGNADTHRKAAESAPREALADMLKSYQEIGDARLGIAKSSKAGAGVRQTAPMRLDEDRFAAAEDVDENTSALESADRLEAAIQRQYGGAGGGSRKGNGR